MKQEQKPNPAQIIIELGLLILSFATIAFAIYSL